MEIPEALDFPNAASWREWLEENHATAREVWLVHVKKGGRRPGLT